MKLKSILCLLFVLFFIQNSVTRADMQVEGNTDQGSTLTTNSSIDDEIMSSSPKRYIFSLKILEELAKSSAGISGADGKNRKLMLEETNQKIKENYPELIIGPNSGEWIFNSVGGSLAEMKILYCSPSEYLAIWGSPVNTSGFSGRYPKMDVWDIMLDGKMTSYAPGGDHQTTIFMNSGPANTEQVSWLKKGIGKQFILEDGAYMIDYGRGDLLSSLSVGLVMGHKYVTGDKYSLNKILSICTKETFKNWLNPERIRAIRHYKETNPDYGN